MLWKRDKDGALTRVPDPRKAKAAEAKVEATEAAPKAKKTSKAKAKKG